LSASLLCEHLGLTEAARAIEAAVTADIEERSSAPRTTAEIGDAIAKRAAG
jgi:3-isopropylmalate dehydrogenase